MADRQMRSALVVDDHPLFCDALAITLGSVAGISRIRTAATLEEALEEIRRSGAPDVVVLDLNLPDVRGLDGLIRMQGAARVPVVVVSSMAEDRVVAAAMKAGAAGYIPKHSQREVFRTAFETLRRGETYLPEGFLPAEEEDEDEISRDEALARIAMLTGQQARILGLITEGKLNKQIAYELSIAETTVKAHMTAIMRKLGVQSRTQAALLASRASFSNVLQQDGQDARFP
ncbi:response regulator transcription factor [Pseudooceanicola sp. CBS1P-1]|uniref:Response regulator n=1 Tax=Pseudooceanicola albus TaxID=2692189 RepID=A0A6L7G8L3_9RHOB|nr:MULTISPECIES: response regulator transcription factor [Pseudooceanicola]MBT9386437.1 response regulator transcription factor [Pseudooceanicola endophyticus]MXN20405.1 response regulator [Pseudooceanicola albus]